MKRIFIYSLVFLFSVVSVAEHKHIHVGRNADGVWGNGDDNGLWIFATPVEPQFPVIEMLPTGEFIGSKQVYVAELDCWHSAHPGTGLFQLDFNDSTTQPDWRIGLKRVSYSDPVNFWVEDEATTLEILMNDGDVFALEEPEWEDDLPDGKGGFGAWHFHTHTEFLALADGAGENFSATFSVFDDGSTGYLESEAYTLDFVTVPEPATIAIFGLGIIPLLRQRRKK